MIFGLLFAVFNFMDAQMRLTGGYDMPASLCLNVPALVLNGVAYRSLNSLQDHRIKTLKQQLSVTDADLQLSRGELEKLTSEEKSEFLARIERYRQRLVFEPAILPIDLPQVPESVFR